MKFCPSCKQTLLKTEFYPARQKRDGLAGYCKQCSKRAATAWNGANRPRVRDRNASATMKYKYGITMDEYGAILVGQGGGCAICGTLPSGKRLHVDHDHASGLVRGILCQGCNVTLGQMRDNPALLRRAAEYLEEGNATTKRVPAKVAGHGSQDLSGTDDPRMSALPEGTGIERERRALWLGLSGLSPERT